MHLINQSLFAKNFSKNSNLDDSGISLSVIPSGTNLKLHISVTPKMVQKVITIHDSLKAYCIPDCIPVVVLNNCEPEPLYNILGELLNIFQKESCFLVCWKVSSVVTLFKNVGQRSKDKNYQPVILLSVVSKGFENL